MQSNYKQLIEKISKASGLDVEEINRRVEAKCAKLSGLISKDGSAQIVASELGVNFEKEKMKISEVLSGMKKVNIVGKIINTNNISEFTTKNGNKGKVFSMNIADDTGNMRTVLWDINHIGLFENGKIKNGDVIEISNASVRNDEIHLGSFSDIKLSKEEFESVKTERKYFEKNISDIKPSEKIKLRAVIVQIHEPRFFDVCPNCEKKASDSECKIHGKITPKKKAVISIVLDDGSDNIRGALFGDQIKQIGFSEEDLENAESFAKKREQTIGEEVFLYVGVRTNKIFNSTEIAIEEIKQVELDNLIENLRVN